MIFGILSFPRHQTESLNADGQVSGPRFAAAVAVPRYNLALAALEPRVKFVELISSWVAAWFGFTIEQSFAPELNQEIKRFFKDL